MNAMQEAMRRVAEKAIASPREFTPVEKTLACGVVRNLNKRKPADKGWDTKLSFKTYSKLHQQGVV